MSHTLPLGYTHEAFREEENMKKRTGRGDKTPRRPLCLLVARAATSVPGAGIDSCDPRAMTVWAAGTAPGWGCPGGRRLRTHPQVRPPGSRHGRGDQPQLLASPSEHLWLCGLPVIIHICPEAEKPAMTKRWPMNPLFQNRWARLFRKHFVNFTLLLVNFWRRS